MAADAVNVEGVVFEWEELRKQNENHFMGE